MAQIPLKTFDRTLFRYVRPHHANCTYSLPLRAFYTDRPTLPTELLPSIFRSSLKKNSKHRVFLFFVPSATGSQSLIKWGGSTSGTPPTRVLTTNNPHDAASTIAIQNASVNEQFTKIFPRHKTYENPQNFPAIFYKPF
jgi:hypothetical protein